MMINKLFCKLLPVNPTMKNGIKISPDATLNVRETTMMSLYRPTDNRSVYYMYFKKILNMVAYDISALYNDHVRMTALPSSAGK